jgi:chromosomal replication initiation ATPase DnaA
MSLPPRIQKIVDQERDKAAEYDRRVTTRQLLGKRNHHEIAWLRHAIWLRVREEIEVGGKPISFPLMGRLFRRDHSTIIHGVNRARAQREENERI